MRLPDEDKTTAFFGGGQYTLGAGRGTGMVIYLDAFMGLNFLVDLCLMVGVNRLSGHPPGLKRAAAAAALGGGYAGVCLVPGLQFLGSGLWRAVSLGLMGWTAFGADRSGWQRSMLFVLLSMALGGIAGGLQVRHFPAVCLCAALLWLLCRVGFGGQQGVQEYVPVELTWQGKTLRLLALRDTGNTLRDPLTGESVLICGADVGEKLLGLPRTAFLDPTGTMAAGILPGARLIPYRSVGQPGGLLLALRMKDVKVGDQRISPLVAFAPQEIGGSCYQMLTGGMECFG